MADIGTRNILCRYYLSNACRDGDECRFSHDRTTGIVDNVCRFFLKGECRYGTRCRYDHVRKLSNGNREVISRGKISKQHDLNQNQKRSAHGTAGASGLSGVSEGRSFAQAVRIMSHEEAEKSRLSRQPLCEYHMISGVCPDKKCRCVHGDFCVVCSKYILHPYNDEARAKHVDECRRKQQEHDVLTRAIAQSATLSCGVCMETVLEKEPVTARRFGILESCSHIFCLQCIRKWRQIKNFNVKTVRGCPECRTPSDFVTPSAYFVEKGEEKRALIEGYKAALATKPCKYFKMGRGSCPFANKCFYKHVLPDGSIAPDAGPPSARRIRTDADGFLAIDDDVVLMELLEATIFEDAYDFESDDDVSTLYDYDDYE